MRGDGVKRGCERTRGREGFEVWRYGGAAVDELVAGSAGLELVGLCIDLEEVVCEGGQRMGERGCAYVEHRCVWAVNLTRAK